MKLASSDDEFPLGSCFTQETSPTVDNETSETNLLPSDTVTLSQPLEHHYPQHQHQRKPQRYIS